MIIHEIYGSAVNDDHHDHDDAYTDHLLQLEFNARLEAERNMFTQQMLAMQQQMQQQQEQQQQQQQQQFELMMKESMRGLGATCDM